MAENGKKGKNFMKKKFVFHKNISLSYFCCHKNLKYVLAVHRPTPDNK